MQTEHNKVDLKDVNRVYSIPGVLNSLRYNIIENQKNKSNSVASSRHLKTTY